MTIFNHSHHFDFVTQFTALMDQFPAGCDPDFDEGPEELERQFAELRMQYANH